MKKLSLFLAFIMMFVFPMSAWAAGTDNSVSALNQKYAGYDLSNANVASKILANDVEFQNLVKSFTLEKVNSTLIQAKNKKGKDSEKLNQYLGKLQNLGAIDSNFKVITVTKATPLSYSAISSYATTSYPSYDLRGKCITNANTMNATYTMYYYVGLALYGNPISAAAYAYTSIGIFFASKVRSGGEWDYKVVLGYSNVYRVTIGSSTYNYTGESIGNFHYGYTGATKFADVILLSAAGLVQIISSGIDISNFSTYFDQPEDQAYITLGISYYRYGSI